MESPGWTTYGLRAEATPFRPRLPAPVESDKAPPILLESETTLSQQQQPSREDWPDHEVFTARRATLYSDDAASASARSDDFSSLVVPGNEDNFRQPKAVDFFLSPIMAPRLDDGAACWTQQQEQRHGRQSTSNDADSCQGAQAMKSWPFTITESYWIEENEIFCTPSVCKQLHFNDHPFSAWSAMNSLGAGAIVWGDNKTDGYLTTQWTDDVASEAPPQSKTEPVELTMLNSQASHVSDHIRRQQHHHQVRQARKHGESFTIDPVWDEKENSAFKELKPNARSGAPKNQSLTHPQIFSMYASGKRFRSDSRLAKTQKMVGSCLKSERTLTTIAQSKEPTYKPPSKSEIRQLTKLKLAPVVAVSHASSREHKKTRPPLETFTAETHLSSAMAPNGSTETDHIARVYQNDMNETSWFLSTWMPSDSAVFDDEFGIVIEERPGLLHNPGETIQATGLASPGQGSDILAAILEESVHAGDLVTKKLEDYKTSSKTDADEFKKPTLNEIEVAVRGLCATPMLLESADTLFRNVCKLRNFGYEPVYDSDYTNYLGGIVVRAWCSADRPECAEKLLDFMKKSLHDQHNYACPNGSLFEPVIVAWERLGKFYNADSLASKMANAPE